MVSLQKYKKIPLKNKPPTKNTPIPLSVVAPQESLTPVFNSPFYATPDEPADPRDCDRYPDSLYCGGFPWSWTPIGIEPSIVLDSCNVGIELKPILGWTILPPVQIVYRKQTPECKEIIEPPSLPTENFTPASIQTKGGCLYRVVVSSTYPTYSYPVTNEGRQVVFEGYTTTRQFHLYWGPVLGILNIETKGKIKPTSIEVTNPTSNYFYEYGEKDILVAYVLARGVYKILYGGTTLTDQYTDNSILTAQYVRDLLSGDTYRFGSPFNPIDVYADYLVKAANNRQEKYHDRSIGVEAYTIANATLTNAVIESIEEVWCSATTSQFLPPPPPPPPKRCDCAMTCCPSTTQNDQLLRSLIKKVDKLSEIVGIDDYPISLPTSLISKDEGFLGNLIPNQNMDISSMTRLLAWYIERFDEIMGQWEIPIEIKDSDPSKPGDQPIGVKLPNMAEAMAEMFTLCFQTNINSETALNLAMRNMSETVADKQQNFITYKLLQSLTDWVGFKQKDINLKMPLNITLNKTRYDEILKESEVDVGVVEFDDKFGLEADLMRFREGMAILQANSKRKIDPKGDIKAQILKYLLDTFKATEKVNGEDDEQDFEDFLKEVETGFINTAGIKDAVNPYGRPFNQRPRIRDLTKYEPPKEP